MKKLLFFLCFCLFLSMAITALPKQNQAAELGQDKVTESLNADDDYLDTVAQPTPDPLEGWNRAVFIFNDVFIDYVARPVSVGYTTVTPRFFRTGVHNFFHNLAFPIRFVNNLLQGKGRAAGVEMSRFVLNTTVGIGGVLDVARNHKPIVPVDEEDMGQTFGVWGMGEGFYIVWPLLGPSTARDSIGMVGDYFLDPVTYVKPSLLGTGIKVGKTINELDSILDTYDDMKRMSVEPYSSIRDSYIQYRRAKIQK